MAKQLPADPDAEASVLGACLADPALADFVLPFLEPADFLKGRHQQVCAALKAMYGQGLPTDVISAAHWMREQKLQFHPLELSDLAEQAAPLPAIARNQARIVKELARRRRLMRAGQDLVDADGDPDTAQEAAAAVLTAFEELRQQGGQAAGPLVSEAWDALEAASQGRRTVGMVQTGFLDLDRLLTGLHPANLVVLAARPGVGKSSLALQIARNVATSGAPVVLFSLEMSGWELGLRLLCAEASIELSRVLDGTLRREEAEAAGRYVEQMADLPLQIVDDVQTTAVDIRSMVRRLGVSRSPPQLVIVDYLQLMVSPVREQSREQEIAGISRSLKLLAAEANVPVLALSQLNREVEHRRDHKPQLSDLRESGSLEQDADVVMMLWQQQEDPFVIPVLVEKHRNGRTGQVKLVWRPHYLQFGDYARPY